MRLKDVGGREFPISGTEVVGRGHAATVCIRRPDLSREHAVLTVQGNSRVLVKDLGSRNGTFVNDTRLRPFEPFEITVGDRVAFSGAVFELVG